MKTTRLKLRVNRLLTTSILGFLLHNTLLRGIGAVVTLLASFLVSLPRVQLLFATHEKLVLSILGSLGAVLVLIECLRWLADYTSPKDETGSDVVDLCVSVGRIVQAKIERFREFVPEMTSSRTNPFKSITKPRDQIKSIFQEASTFFRTRAIAEEAFDATVIRKDDQTKWSYLATSNPHRQRTEASALMSSKSCAAEAIATGTRIFHASKTNASNNERYLRSKFEGDADGSIYCYPVFVTLADESCQTYVITFATYGKQLCDEDDSMAVEGTKLIFREYCRRIELELLLLTIKTRFESLKATPKSNSKNPKPRTNPKKPRPQT